MNSLMDYQLVARVMQECALRNKVTYQDISVLSSQGVPIMVALADHFRVQVNQVPELLDAGAIKFNALFICFVKLAQMNRV